MIRYPRKNKKSDSRLFILAALAALVCQDAQYGQQEKTVGCDKVVCLMPDPKQILVGKKGNKSQDHDNYGNNSACPGSQFK
jgi:hypothetical protein